MVLLSGLAADFCLWSDATEDCEEETAGSEPSEGKGVKKKARILPVVPPVRLKSRCEGNEWYQRGAR